MSGPSDSGLRLELVVGDITDQAVDAIVNAANDALAGGGGVDGAIHRAGGRRIMQETNQRYPEGCPPGSAVITSGGELPARYVIHAVGPIWRGGHHGEAELLRSAYARSLELSVEHQCRSVAFPAISTGAFGYPIQEAAVVSLRTVLDHLRSSRQPASVRFVLFSQQTLQEFDAALHTLLAE